MKTNQIYWIIGIVFFFSGYGLGLLTMKYQYQKESEHYIDEVERMLDLDAENKLKDKDIMLIPLKMK